MTEAHPADRVRELERTVAAQRRTIEALMDAAEQRNSVSAQSSFALWQEQVGVAGIVDRKTRRLREALEEIRALHTSLTEKTYALELAAGSQRAIVEALDANICILDEHGVIIETNAYWTAFATQHEEVTEAIGAILAGSAETFILDMPCAGPDGRWFQVRVCPLPHVGQGRVVLAYLDITNLVEAERALAAKSEEAALLALVARHMESAVTITDAEGHIQWANESFTQQTGYTLEEAVGRFPTDLMHGPEQGAALLARILARTQRGEGFCEELMRRAKTGRTFPAEIEIHPILGPDGQLRQMVGIARDITARRKAEARLAQAERLESIGLLAAGVAHEINTPMQYIGDNLTFVRKAIEIIKPLLDAMSLPTPDCDAAAEVVKGRRFGYVVERVPLAVDQALEGVTAVSKIVRAMRAFSHLDPNVEKAPTDVNTCVEMALTVSRNEWKYVAEVETRLAPDLPPVLADEGGLNQVFLNLLVNAGHAIATVVRGEERGQIIVTSRHDPASDEVVIEITDSGPGIPSDIVGRIFDPFFTTKDVGKGTGQGLTLARTIVVTRHGGSIDVVSPPGGGAVFSVRLPVGAAGGGEVAP